MKTLALFVFLISTSYIVGQNLESNFPKEKMKIDLNVFKEIREEANSGLYKYRTKEEIDSIYQWASNEIETSNTYLDFYKIICTLTDFEGSLHNDTDFSGKLWKNIRKEESGYFPFPVKWISDKWVINFENEEIPLGAEIISINGLEIKEIIESLYKYYSTDGYNTTGKRIGLRQHFSRYFRFEYGLQDEFEVIYKAYNSTQSHQAVIKSASYAAYYHNFWKRHSRPSDQMCHANLKEDQKYAFKKINSETSILAIRSFGMGNEDAKEHKKYAQFLDSVFNKLRTDKTKHLIVDVRQNGGGNDPNDLLTLSYLMQRNFQENTQAWISFRKIPKLRYIYTKVPTILRPIFVGKYNKMITEDFYIEKDNHLYQGPLSKDQKIWEPNEMVFQKNIYLLIDPAVASASSLFASMLVGEENVTSIGEETMGGFHGHNGHTELRYVLPNSKIESFFSVVNLNQDVRDADKQIFGYGVKPDYNVEQTLEDFLSNKDTQLEFTLNLINNSSHE